MNKRIILILIFSALLFGIVGAQWDEREIVNLGELIGSEVVIQGQGIDYSYDENNEVSFSSDDSVLQVGELFFENLKKGSLFKFNSEGEIIKAGFTTNEKGGIYTLGGVEFEVPPNTRVTYLEDIGEIRLISSENQKFSKLPVFDEESSSSFFLDSSEGKWELAQGHFLEDGDIQVKRGGFYSDANSQIDGILFGEYSSGVPIYFEGEISGENFIYFGEENLDGSGKFEINFKEDNSYLKIEEGDYFRVSLKGGSFDLNSNSKTGLIPDLNVRGNSQVSQDSIHLEFLEDKVFVSNFGKKFTSTSPMKISFLKEDGSPALGAFDSDFQKNLEGEEYQLLVDNFNRVAVVPVGLGEEFLAKSEGIDTKFSSKVSYNYLEKEDMFVLLGDSINNPQESYYQENLDIFLNKGTESFYYGRLRDYWKTLPKEAKSSFGQIYLLEENNLPAVGGEAFYNPQDKSVYFQTGLFNLDVFRHEMAHAQHHHSSKFPFEEYSDFEESSESLGEIINEYVSKGDLSNEFKKLYLSKFLEYNDFKSTPSINIHSTPPSEGFFSEYGKENVREDVAVTVEKVVGEPEIFKDLINPDSPNYDSKYGPIYRGKLDVVYKYGFITDEEYQRVLDIAGVKK